MTCKEFCHWKVFYTLWASENPLKNHYHKFYALFWHHFTKWCHLSIWTKIHTSSHNYTTVNCWVSWLRSTRVHHWVIPLIHLLFIKYNFLTPCQNCVLFGQYFVLFVLSNNWVCQTCQFQIISVFNIMFDFTELQIENKRSFHKNAGEKKPSNSL